MNEKYLQYGLSDFLEDDDFIGKVRSHSPEIAKWKVALEKHPGVQESMLQAITLIEQMRFKEDKLPESRVQSLWHRINPAGKETRPKSRRILVRRLAISGVAAAFILFFGWLWLFINHNKYISTYAGEQVHYELPDQSSITLNAISFVRFDKSGFLKNRTIEMEGEVRFEVEKGGDFVVKSPLGTVYVLGTTFNVYSRDSFFRVECHEGHVRIKTQIGTTEITGQNVFEWNLRNDEANRFPLPSDEMRAWQKGEFRYKNAQVTDVFKEMERQFDIGIKIDPDIDLSERFYTGLFTTEDLEMALQAVCWPMHLDYKILGKQVMIVKSQSF